MEDFDFPTIIWFDSNGWNYWDFFWLFMMIAIIIILIGVMVWY